MKIELELDVKVEKHLVNLVRIGLHGATPTEVAERLVCQQLERLLIDGVLRDLPL